MTDTHSGFLMSGVSCLTGGFLLLRILFCYFCESSYFFYLSFNFDFFVSKIMHLIARTLSRKLNNWFGSLVVLNVVLFSCLLFLLDMK